MIPLRFASSMWRVASGQVLGLIGRSPHG
jgi:hypothetical protein